MDCIFCGEWFVSSGDSTICPPCEKAMKRLGIKMSPDRLRQLVQAEKDGRIVLLPCKQGDTLWTFCTYPFAKVYKFNVTDISMLNGRTMLNTDLMGVVDATDVGKTVFLTREEAEKALEENRCGE